MPLDTRSSTVWCTQTWASIPQTIACVRPPRSKPSAHEAAKTVFAASCADGFDLDGRDQVVVCGIEAHVCVHQTVEDLAAKGVEVHVPVDAVGSRFAQSREIGIEKARRAGAVITNVETALFELVGRAGTDEFKEIQRVVLDFAPNPA